MNAISEIRAAGPELRSLAERIRELCGDDQQAFIDTLDGETDAIDAARRVIRWINEQSANAETNKQLSETYRARQKLFEERIGRARSALFQFMQDMGQRSMPLPEATLTIVAGAEQVVGDPDPAALPDHLVRIKREPDKTAIKAALKAGEIIDGCSLSNGTPSLQVRVK